MTNETKVPKRRGRPPKVKSMTLEQAQLEISKMARNQLDVMNNVPPKSKPILEEAHETIYGDREQTYGDPGKNLRTIAAYWNTYLRSRNRDAAFAELDYADVCNMMVLMKVARLGNSPGHRDSLVDIAGYTALQDRVMNHDS